MRWALVFNTYSVLDTRQVVDDSVEALSVSSVFCQVETSAGSWVMAIVTATMFPSRSNHFKRIRLSAAHAGGIIRCVSLMTETCSLSVITPSASSA